MTIDLLWKLHISGHIFVLLFKIHIGCGMMQNHWHNADTRCVEVLCTYTTASYDGGTIKFTVRVNYQLCTKCLVTHILCVMCCIVHGPD